MRSSTWRCSISRITPCLVALVLAVNISPLIEAQRPEMPEPLAIVVDADGKPMVQVIGIDDIEVRVLFEFDGDPVVSIFRFTRGSFSATDIYFSLDNCEGSVYLHTWYSNNPLDFQNQRRYEVYGPDHSSGTYRVFRTTAITTAEVTVESVLDVTSGTPFRCVDLAGHQVSLMEAEEMLPNPLDGFLGPTDANPERLLTVRGGTRLP